MIYQYVCLGGGGFVSIVKMLNNTTYRAIGHFWYLIGTVDYICHLRLIKVNDFSPKTIMARN